MHTKDHRKRSSGLDECFPAEWIRNSIKQTEFRDGRSLRYSWNPENVPLSCPRGEIFSLTLALHSPRGGYTIVRHNEMRDTFANLMSEVCRDVGVARLDIKAKGLGNSL